MMNTMRIKPFSYLVSYLSTVLLLLIASLAIHTHAAAQNKVKPLAAPKGLEAQFAVADTDKVGKISKKQAFKAQMYEVDRYFFDMDTDIDGYVTIAEIKAWKANPIRTSPRPRGDKLDRFVPSDETRR